MQPLIKPLMVESEFYIEEGCFVVELTTAEEDHFLSMARCRVEPGKTTRWHRLSDTVERYVIQSGTGLVEVGVLPPRKLEAGDVVVIPAGCRQRISNPGNHDLVFIAICTPRFQSACYQDVE